MSADDPRSFAGERLVDVSFAGARLHSPDFEGARITDAWLVNADVSGAIDGLRINDVEIAPLVQAELDRRFPERVALRATDQAGLQDAWRMLEGIWAATVERARSLPEAALHERVDDEYSFVETLRHLIFATDAWVGRMVLGRTDHYHPWGLPGSFLADPAALGIDASADPALDEVLLARRERMDLVARTIASLSGDGLDRVCVPPDEAGHPREPHTVGECLRVVLEEEWEHDRYAERDLTVLEQRGA